MSAAADDKPLHVRVAEALGWFRFEPSANGLWPDEWRGVPPKPIIGEPAKEVPRYDTDWSATGPLIEKYGLGVDPEPQLTNPDMRWYASLWPNGYAEGAEEGRGPTPLIAVCNLILALKEAGKL